MSVMSVVSAVVTGAPATTTLTLTLASGGTARAASTFHVAATGTPTGIVDLFDGSLWRASGLLTTALPI